MVVGLATDVFVGLGDSGRWFFGLDLVELGIQDVLDALVGVNAGHKSTVTGGLQALLTVAAAETQQSQTGAVGLLRMLAGVKQRLYELGCARANALRPTREAIR